VLTLMGGGGDNSLGGSEGEVGRSHDDRVSDDVGSSRAVLGSATKGGGLGRRPGREGLPWLRLGFVVTQ
jgi:hypothetical protein